MLRLDVAMKGVSMHACCQPVSSGRGQQGSPKHGSRSPKRELPSQGLSAHEKLRSKQAAHASGAAWAGPSACTVSER